MATTRDNEQEGAVAPPQALLPEFWPDQAVPRRIRRVWMPWPIAVVLAPLFWVMPKRLGVHLATGSWWGPIVGHIFWAYYALGWFMLTAFWRGQCSWAVWLGLAGPRDARHFWPVPTFGEMLRSPLAAVPHIAGNEMGAKVAVAVIGFMIVVEVFVLIAAILLMPYATAGEPLKRVFGRCLKLAWWTATGLTACGIVFNGAMATSGMANPMMGLTFALCSLWLTLVLVRSGGRYAGPVEGAEWEPISPQCDRCGYGLTALPYDNQCPECCLPVRDSLPDSRQPSRFAAARGTAGRLAAFVPTYAAVLWGRGFFQRLRVRGEHSAARCFAVWTCLLASAVMSWPVLLVLDYLFSYYRTVPRSLLSLQDWAMAVTTWGFMSVILIASLGAIVLLSSGFGYRPLRRHAIVVFYWSAWWLPVGVTAIITSYLVWWLLQRELFHYTIQLPQMGTLNLYQALAVLPAAIPIGLAVHSLFRLGRAIRQTQYANA